MLGEEVIAVLEEERTLVSELRAFASDSSVGRDIDFAGDVIAVETGEPRLKGLDLVILCTPPEAALGLVRAALRSEVPCLDCSGSLVSSSDVPLVIASLGSNDLVSNAPLLSTPVGPALSWAPVLSALQRAAGLERVVGTVLHSASAAGHRGIAALSDETTALLNQREPQEPGVFPWPVAFDCHPYAAQAGEAGEKEGYSKSESLLTSALERLLGPDVGLAITSIQVPAFAGEASSLTIQTTEPLEPSAAIKALEAASGIDVRPDANVPGLRDGVGLDEVLVSRVRSDRSHRGAGSGLQLWISADPVRLAAVNVVKLARARFSLD